MRQTPTTAVRSDILATPPKLRPCLRCSTPFHSAWAGERICVQCKGTAAWRQGSPLRTHPGGG